MHQVWTTAAAKVIGRPVFRDHATSEIASGSKPGIEATKKLPSEGFKRPWPPLIRMDETVRKRIDALLGGKP
jgi:3-polyprenyl-4-hydroxybenzoate decarboxylase